MKLALVWLLFGLQFDSSLEIFKASRNAENESSTAFRSYSGLATMHFSYAVKIFSRESQKTLSGYSCSGSIVHHLWILTAAHCVYGFEVFDVFVGNVTNDIDHVVRAAEAFIHPNYSFDPELLNDIAMLKLKRSLETLNSEFQIVTALCKVLMRVIRTLQSLFQQLLRSFPFQSGWISEKTWLACKES